MRKDVFKKISMNSTDEIGAFLLQAGISTMSKKATTYALNAAVARAVVASTVRGLIRKD